VRRAVSHGIPTARRAADRAPPEWVAHRERGSLTMLRVMAFISLRIGRPAGRVVLHGIAAYFFVFAPTARRHMRTYLRRALGREPGAADRYRLILTFATTIHDRLYLMRERWDLFDISLDGINHVASRIERGEGAFLLGAHFGSFEVTHALGRRQSGLKVAMAMYEHNARKINAMLAAVNPGLALDIIPLGLVDSVLQIRASLEAGTFVGLLGDRTIGGDRHERVTFLGMPASFPSGAMRVAAMLRRPVIFMAGLQRGTNRYHVVFEELADFSTLRDEDRDEAIRAAVARYAAVLERYCRSDPYNWFNFFDFWQQAVTARHS